MKEVMYFDSFEDLQRYVVENLKDYIKLRPQEIVSSNKPVNDERIGWLDSDHLCIDSFDKVEDKKDINISLAENIIIHYV